MTRSKKLKKSAAMAAARAAAAAVSAAISASLPASSKKIKKEERRRRRNKNKPDIPDASLPVSEPLVPVPIPEANAPVPAPVPAPPMPIQAVGTRPIPEANAPVPAPPMPIQAVGTRPIPEANAPGLAPVPAAPMPIQAVGTVSWPQRAESVESMSGFIFFCSAATKHECFRFGVFALPRGRIELVGRIKAGASLFLYDYNERVIHGIFRATSNGGLNLAPEAFGGRFPAQVKFKIEKVCFPLPESVFQQAIEENYEAPNRFKPDLSSNQVHKLCAMFKPMDVRPQIALPQIVNRAQALQPVHLTHAQPAFNPHFVPTVDPLHVPPYGSSAAPNLYVVAPNNRQHQPVPEPRQALSVNMHPDVPCGPVPQNSTHPQTNTQLHCPDHRATFTVNTETVVRQPVPPARNYPPTIDYQSVTSPRSERLELPYYIEHPTAHVPSVLQYATDPSHPYSETIHRNVSSRAATAGPVSSRYSFDGVAFRGAAPAYR